MATTASRTALLTPLAQRRANRALLYTFLALGGVVTCFPFVWMLLTSFKNYAEAIATPPTVFPSEWGVRLRVLWELARAYPLVPLLLLGWTALGVVVMRRWADARLKALYLTAHLALFFVIGSLKPAGRHIASASCGSGGAAHRG